MLTMMLLAALGVENAVSTIPGHAHNDYEHKRPLLDALDHGFSSVEADVYLVNGQLLVAHDLFRARRERTLDALYLDPLLQRTQSNKGSVYPDGKGLLLLIDIKSDGPSSYRAIAETLARHKEMLTRYTKNGREEKGVTVVISGNCPRELIMAAPEHAGIDGRVGDLSRDSLGPIMPLISDSWGSHFRYRGKGPMPSEEREKLRDIVQKAHARGQKVRFWATPEKETLWNELAEAGVDYINTDQLSRLRDHLTRKR